MVHDGSTGYLDDFEYYDGTYYWIDQRFQYFDKTEDFARPLGLSHNPSSQMVHVRDNSYRAKLLGTDFNNPHHPKQGKNDIRSGSHMGVVSFGSSVHFLCYGLRFELSQFSVIQYLEFKKYSRVSCMRDTERKSVSFAKKFKNLKGVSSNKCFTDSAVPQQVLR